MSDGPTLRAGLLELVLAPEVGGSIARFDLVGPQGAVPIMRPAAGSGNILDAACFPLVPFVNRIRGGTFACDGRAIVLAANSPPDPSPMHGQGWRGSWEVAHTDATSAELVFKHPAGEWPWSYEARQTFKLDHDGLTIALSCTNVSDARMPCGLGFHPYFPCDDKTRLDTRVEGAWTIDDKVLPVARVAPQGRYDLANRAICGQSLDNGFDGWSGRATLRYTTHDTVISSPTAKRFQVYSPPAGGIVVAEPVGNANAALNAPQEEWADLGIALLERGKTATLEARFQVVTC